jgi:hypothetical protein
MDYKKLSLGLGVFSIALGAAELLASRRIARGLGVEGREGVIKAFGARELAAGAGILASPAHSGTIWNRVLGDAMDLATLGLAARRNPRNPLVWGAIGFVAGATAVDVLTARGLDRTTGKFFPTGDGKSAETHAALRQPTSIEPPHVAPARAPAVA